MALTLQSLQSDQLAKQRLGAISVSYTNWTATTEDEMTAGSMFEDAGSVYYAGSDNDIDTTNTLAGLGNSWVYVYFDPATLGLYCSASAPAWDDAKQGYYLAAAPTHRCVEIFFKVGAGNYTKKTIPVNRNSGITTQDICKINETTGYVTTGYDIARFVYGNAGSNATLTESAWTKINFDTEIVNNISNCTLAANVFSLPAGTYYVKFTGFFYSSDPDNIAIRIRNTTAGTTLCADIQGKGVAVANPITNFNSDPFICLDGIFTLSATSNIEIQCYCLSSGSTWIQYGYGTYEGETFYRSNLWFFKIK